MRPCSNTESNTPAPNHNPCAPVCSMLTLRRWTPLANSKCSAAVARLAAAWLWSNADGEMSEKSTGAPDESTSLPKCSVSVWRNWRFSSRTPCVRLYGGAHLCSTSVEQLFPHAQKHSAPTLTSSVSPGRAATTPALSRSSPARIASASSGAYLGLQNRLSDPLQHSSPFVSTATAATDGDHHRFIESGPRNGRVAECYCSPMKLE